MKKTSYKLSLLYWGGYFLLFIWYCYGSHIEEYRSSEKFDGVVVDRLEGRTSGFRSRGRRYYYPQVEFNYGDSAYLFGGSDVFAPGRFDVGDRVVVMVPESDPDKAFIYSRIQFWVSLPALFFTFMGALFLYAMVVFVGWYGEHLEVRRRAGGKGT